MPFALLELWLNPPPPAAFVSQGRHPCFHVAASPPTSVAPAPTTKPSAASLPASTPPRLSTPPFRLHPAAARAATCRPRLQPPNPPTRLSICSLTATTSSHGHHHWSRLPQIGPTPKSRYHPLPDALPRASTHRHR
ncbi:splicing factor, proline- and glutamine-rich-like [Cajanus cajan]|uniref:splicing factor, proline- and glutamine-rich-like n=1 Tax=Cajanus cajan TaxID=3821 RepID=UPI00098D7899|nr:splicing factor, proline- and glutamine-rich-like [Cajanus cajan]